MDKTKTIALLNASIVTADGTYTLKTITLDEAKNIVNGAGVVIDSAIGHQSTADILTSLLGLIVPLNRQAFRQEAGQKAIIFKLNGRPEEGKILTSEEIEAIGYSFQLLSREA